MTDISELQAYIDTATISEDVFKLRPDYRAVLIAVSGVQPGPSNDESEALLKDAEASARQRLSNGPVIEIAHVAAWQEAYRAFGTKPN